MRTLTKISTAAVLLGTSLVALTAEPASAAVTVTVAGTELGITMTGQTTLRFSCSAGKVAVNGSLASPNVACSALTKVTATGDSATQLVHGDDLGAAAFTKKPWLSINTGGGPDTVRETLGTDAIDTGTGSDLIVLLPGSMPNQTLITGTDLDRVDVYGSAANETILASSTNSTVSLSVPGPSGIQSVTNVSGAEWVWLSGGGGNDILSGAGITDASAIDTLDLSGDAGNDTLTGGPVTGVTTLIGGAGTNVLTGTDGKDEIYTDSETDDITPGKGLNHVYDHDSLRAGGRTYHGTSGGVTVWDLRLKHADAVVRVRADATSATELTTSLNRPGRQTGLTNSVTGVDIWVDDGINDKAKHLGLADVVALPNQRRVSVSGRNIPGNLVDITVPTGAWTTTGTVGGTYTVKPANTASIFPGDVVVTGITNISVHGPWINTNQGFAHRVVRDLQFRFPTPTERDTIRDLLGNGTETPSSVVATLMDTDLYRGLDVDRVFVKFLRRASDPSGRTYWINSLNSGKSLLQFRAQLFGSNEYFTKAGATNAAFMVKAYNDVMGRAPDPSGQTYWTNKLNNGADRGAVAREFLKSTEARRNIVKDQFLRFLDRYPTTGEASAWVTNLAAPRGELDLIALLASSAEYRART